MTEPFVVAPDEPQQAAWKVLAEGHRTGGLVMFGDARMPPGSPSPSLHVHSREDEAAYVIEGVMTFVVGERRFEAGPGTLVWLPRGIPHTFANLSAEPVWAFGVTTPAGLEGMFEQQAAYFASLSGPPDPDVLARLGAEYGVAVVGPPLGA